MKRTLYSFLFFLLFSGYIFSQNQDVQVGSSLLQRLQSQGAFYDYSDPDGLNIKVSVWGFVRYPGKYIISAKSNVNDLLSYAGGPSNDTEFENMSLIRTNPDSSQAIVELKYNDILFDEKMKLVNRPPQLMPGDILIVPGQPKLYFRDYLTISLSVLSVLISLTILFKRG